MRKVTSAGGVVIKEINHQPHILLIIKDNGQLAFPKGHVEGSESLEAAALREVQEETGLQDLVIGKEIGVVVRDSLEVTGEKVSKVIHLFKVSSTSWRHAEKTEENYGWFTFEVALQKMKFEEERRFLRLQMVNWL